MGVAKGGAELKCHAGLRGGLDEIGTSGRNGRGRSRGTGRANPLERPLSEFAAEALLLAGREWSLDGTGEGARFEARSTGADARRSRLWLDGLAVERHRLIPLRFHQLQCAVLHFDLQLALGIRRHVHATERAVDEPLVIPFARVVEGRGVESAKRNNLREIAVISLRNLRIDKVAVKLAYGERPWMPRYPNGIHRRRDDSRERLELSLPSRLDAATDGKARIAKANRSPGALVFQRSATSSDAKQQRERAAKLLRVSR